MPTNYSSILADFSPYPVGDPVGPYGETYYVTIPSVIVVTVISFALTAFLMWILPRFFRRFQKVLFPKSGGNCSCQGGSAKTPKGSNISNPRLSEAKPGGRNPLQDNDLEEVEPTLLGNKAFQKYKVLRCLFPFFIGISTLVCGTAMHFYYGGPYCYENYCVPKKPSDIVIWFSGSDDGAYGCHYAYSNFERAAWQFGLRRVALFNFTDVAQAVAYASRLPDGSRIIVRGHSMGGASAVKFCQAYLGKILLLDTRDSTSWFGHVNEKPSNVCYWRNVLPEDTRLFSTHPEHPQTNYWGRLNMANVFRLLGRPWNAVHGADNRLLPGADHHECGNNLIEDFWAKP